MTAAANVHSLLRVGFDRGNMMGRLLMAVMCLMMASVKQSGLVLQRDAI